MTGLRARLGLVLALTGLVAAGAWAGDFRGVRWGAMPAEVRDAEQAGFVGVDGTALVYATTLAGIDVQVRYHFLDARLAEGMYVSVEEYSNANQHLEDYIELKGLLTEKYGDPEEDLLWSNDLFRGDTSNLGTAISLGHVTVRAMWDLPRTTIGMVLLGDAFEIQHALLYSEKATAAEREARRAQKARDQL